MEPRPAGGPGGWAGVGGAPRFSNMFCSNSSVFLTRPGSNNGEAATVPALGEKVGRAGGLEDPAPSGGSVPGCCPRGTDVGFQAGSRWCWKAVAPGSWGGAIGESLCLRFPLAGMVAGGVVPGGGAQVRGPGLRG